MWTFALDCSALQFQPLITQIPGMCGTTSSPASKHLLTVKVALALWYVQHLINKAQFSQKQELSGMLVSQAQLRAT